MARKEGNRQCQRSSAIILTSLSVIVINRFDVTLNLFFFFIFLFLSGTVFHSAHESWLEIAWCSEKHFCQESTNVKSGLLGTFFTIFID